MIIIQFFHMSITIIAISPIIIIIIFATTTIMLFKTVKSIGITIFLLSFLWFLLLQWLYPSIMNTTVLES